MSEIFNSDKDIQEELRLCMIYIESTRDDPILCAQMIENLYNTFSMYKRRVPTLLAEFLEKEKQRIAPLIQKIIEEKKIEYIELIERKKEEEEKIQDIEEERPSNISRTKLIFGDNF